MDYDTQLNKPAIELALAEVASARGMMAQVSYINSGYGVSMWRWFPWQPMRQINLYGFARAKTVCQVAIVAGIGGFAGAYIDEGYAVLGDYALWSIQWGQLPYCEICLHSPWFSRYAQQGAILHELDHLLCKCTDLGHTRGTPWERLFRPELIYGSSDDRHY